LEGEAFGVVGFVFADPGKAVGDDLEVLVVEVDDVAFEGGLAEDAVHEAACFFLVEVEGGIAVFAVEGEVVFPEGLG
jgi:hypothetical protein